MSNDEKNKFISEESDKILEKFGRVEGDQINKAGLERIRRMIDYYFKRSSARKIDSCAAGEYINSDLESVLVRGSKYAKTIGEQFSAEGLPAQTGIYVAMIESEFCKDIQSPSGLQGMFQLTYQTAVRYDLKAVKGGTPKDRDERFNIPLASRASAKYISRMATEYFSDGMNSTGCLLAIAAFNSGEGAAKKNIQAVGESTKKKNLTFWDLAENSHLTDNQFRAENIKYIPKFFAAWIIGENPQMFNINIAPLSASK